MQILKACGRMTGILILVIESFKIVFLVSVTYLVGTYWNGLTVVSM